MTCGCSTSSDTDVLNPGNDQILVLLALVSQATSLPIPDATVTATLQDPNGNEVVGLTNLEMDESGSPFAGNYSGQILGSEFNPEPGNGYTLVVTIVSTMGNAKLTKPYRVADRSQ